MARAAALTIHSREVSAHAKATRHGFVTADSIETITLPSLPQEIRTACDFATGEPVTVTQDRGTTTFTLPSPTAGDPVRVLQLTFDEAVRMHPDRPKELDGQGGGGEPLGYY